VHTSSGSGNLKRIFIPRCSGLDIHLGVHEPEEKGFQLTLCNPPKDFILIVIFLLHAVVYLELSWFFMEYLVM